MSGIVLILRVFTNAFEFILHQISESEQNKAKTLMFDTQFAKFMWKLEKTEVLILAITNLIFHVN